MNAAVVLMSLALSQSQAFDRWESLAEPVSVSSDAQANAMAAVFASWESLGTEAAFAKWDDLCRHKCGAECTCGDECECGANCECITKKSTPGTQAKSAKPSAKLSPESQKKLEAARAKPKADLSELTPHYPVRDSRTWWSHPGQRTKENLVAHLMAGEHAGKFNRDMLNQLSLAELESLHSDDHEHRLKPVAVLPKTSADVPKKMVPVYENRRVCNGGFCTTTRVIVGYRWE